MGQEFRPHYFPSEEQLQAVRAPYLSHLPKGGHILDVGCGRGEFLDLLRQHGYTGFGIESDPALVTLCHQKGLDVEKGDILGWMHNQSQRTWDGIFIGHVIEHLPSHDAWDLLRMSASRLNQGGRLIVLTPNPNFLPGVGTFWSDMTHVRPYPLRGLCDLVNQVGLKVVSAGTDPASRLKICWWHPYEALVNSLRLLCLKLLMLEDYDGGEIFVVGERA